MSDNTSGFTPLVFSACVHKSYSAVPVPANMHTVHKAKQRNTIYNMKLHSYYRQTAEDLDCADAVFRIFNPPGPCTSRTHCPVEVCCSPKGLQRCGTALGVQSMHR